MRQGSVQAVIVPDLSLPIGAEIVKPDTVWRQVMQGTAGVECGRWNPVVSGREVGVKLRPVGAQLREIEVVDLRNLAIAEAQVNGPQIEDGLRRKGEGVSQDVQIAVHTANRHAQAPFHS